MRVNRVLVGLLLWLGAVVMVAGLAWFAIDSAGRSVTALPVGEAAATDPAQASTAADDTSTSDPGPTAAPVPTTTPRPQPTSVVPTGVSTGAATSRPAGSSNAARHSQPSSSTPSQATRSSAPTPQPVRKTLDGPWGSLTIACTADRVALYSATPADGWNVKVDSNGPVKVEAEFNGRQGPPVHIEGLCNGNGKPFFTFESGD
jgi:hypothetical protein